MKLPKAKKYSLVYKKSTGITNYIVSNPIEETKDSITVYAMKRGVRTFQRNKIVSLSVLGETVTV